MLIKVFGKWINPERISFLRNNYDDNNVNTEIHFHGVTVDAAFNYHYNDVFIRNKTQDEVAEEINNQIALGT